MSEEFEDLCAGCEIGTDCCKHLTDLRLSESEYERLFASHGDAVRVWRTGKSHMLSAPNGCPHLRGVLCSIYHVRPIECRLFPHSIEGIRRLGPVVVASYHHRTRCPRKQRLLASRREAEDMIRSLVKDMYGDHVPVVVLRDTPPIRMVRFLAHAVSKFLRRMRSLERVGDC